MINHTENEMPSWLLKEENYTPNRDRDTFINKSILSLMGIISRVRNQSVKNEQFKANAVLKMIFTLMLIILLSLSRNFNFIVIIDVLLLVFLAMMNGEEIVKILSLSLIVSLFTFVILIPAAIWGNSYSCIMITSKVFASVTTVSIISHTTKWNYITDSFKFFFVPDIFILVLDISIKYIAMLGEFSLHMLYSLKLRSVGMNRNKYASVSGVAGTMFIKSKEMADDMYSAMECRGFTGGYRKVYKFKLKAIDFVYITINIAIFLTFIYFERVK